jgi:hypothetical protein
LTCIELSLLRAGELEPASRSWLFVQCYYCWLLGPVTDHDPRTWLLEVSMRGLARHCFTAKLGLHAIIDVLRCNKPSDGGRSCETYICEYLTSPRPTRVTFQPTPRRCDLTPRSGPGPGATSHPAGNLPRGSGADAASAKTASRLVLGDARRRPSRCRHPRWSEACCDSDGSLARRLRTLGEK